MTDTGENAASTDTGSILARFWSGPELGAWLASRRERTILARVGTGSLSVQAKLELTARRELQGAELAAMLPVPLAWADALTEVVGGEQLSASIFAVDADGTFRAALWGEWAVAASDARASGHPDDTYAARYGLDEAELDRWLRSLTPGQDDAVRDALSRWWADVYPMEGARGGADDNEFRSTSAAGFAAVGLRVAEG